MLDTNIFISRINQTGNVLFGNVVVRSAVLNACKHNQLNSLLDRIHLLTFQGMKLIFNGFSCDSIKTVFVFSVQTGSF